MKKHFLGFPQRFLPGRGQDDAQLDPLTPVISSNDEVSWILDADTRSFFDSVSHEWLV